MLENGYFTKSYQNHLEQLKIDSLESYIESYNKTYRILKDNKPKYLNILLNNDNETSEDDELKQLLTTNNNNIIEEIDESVSSGYTTLYSDEHKDEGLEEKDGASAVGEKQENESVNGFDSILNNERFKNSKINKNQLTIKPRTKEEIKDFQQQETERYKNPHLPWEYKNPDGSTSVVAPVQKKMYTQATSKPRDHVLLKSDRPSYVTILCLGRDAAARLPDGVGTRADICDLLKDSQYVNERLSDSQINNIVSGALDRLHYEKDPCVKYDLTKKLWIYLHKNRSIDYQPWNEHLKKDSVDTDLALKEGEEGANNININLGDDIGGEGSSNNYIKI
jgi:hypothetical protein